MSFMSVISGTCNLYSYFVASDIALSSLIMIAYCMTDIIGGMNAFATVSVPRCLCKASATPQARLAAKILSAVSSVVCTPFSR